jgi:hypothetical protein
MGTIVLDSDIEEQVASARVLEIGLGGDESMLVFSGIARPEIHVNHDAEVAHDEVVVKLGQSALDVSSYTADVGLASVTNGESTFVFATDVIRLDHASAGAELQLRVATAVLGEGTALGRFGYQVVAIVRQLQNAIRGTVRWHKSLLDPAGQDPNQLLEVLANTIDLVSDPSGVFVPTETLHPFLAAVLLPVEDAGDDWLLRYEIFNVPFGQPLKITATPFAPFGGHPRPVLATASGPNPVEVTDENQVTGPDFRLAVQPLIP